MIRTYADFPYQISFGRWLATTCLSAALVAGTCLPVMAEQMNGEGGLVQTVDHSALTMEAKGRIKALGAELQAALKGAIQAGGHLAAVEACNLQAPGIAQSLSDGAWKVGRTSLRTRNAGNQPDTWESEVLARFDRQSAEGKPVEELVHAETVDIDGHSVFRFMKAISVQEGCLGCHGDPGGMNPELTQKIHALYPQDRAIGYKVGDIRGAFSLSKQLD